MLKNKGFSYLEILVATAVLAVSLVPALDSLYTSLRLSEENQRLAEEHFWLQSKVNTVLAEKFSVLDTEALALNSHQTMSTLLSDPSATTNRRVVYVSRYDMDNVDNDNDPFTGKDDAMLWIRIELPGSRSFETIISGV